MGRWLRNIAQGLEQKDYRLKKKWGEITRR